VAADNATVLGVNIAEGCPAANMNNALRQALADVAGGVNVSLLGTFLASTTLAQARSALGVTEGTASQTAFAALTNTANSLPYMTGSDAWALATLTTFGRSLIDDGDAATARTTLGVPGMAVTTDTDGKAIALTISGTTYYLQYGTKSIGGNTTAAVTFPEPFIGTPTVIGGGGHSGTSDADQIRVVTSTVSTTGFTLVNSDASTLTGHWVAIGS
jgi:hypothetical protein